MDATAHRHSDFYGGRAYFSQPAFGSLSFGLMDGGERPDACPKSFGRLFVAEFPVFVGAITDADPPSHLFLA